MRRPAPFALRYYAYRGASAVGFTAPIWSLYRFENGLSYAEVAAVNAVWWTGLVVFELPTGYVADRIGSLGRATVLSAAGMVYTTLAIPFELGADALAEVLGPLRTVALFGSILLAGSLLVLALGRPFATDDTQSAPRGSEPSPAADPDGGAQPDE